MLNNIESTTFSKVGGVAFSVDITRSEKSSIELENSKNGRIKNKLLDDLISNVEFLLPTSLVFKRTNGIIVFFKIGEYKLSELNETINIVYLLCREIISNYNNHFKNEELFKGSYGAEFSKENVIFLMNGKRELLGVAANVSYKLAAHNENQQSLYIGKNLSLHISHDKTLTINAIKGIQYPAYKFKTTPINNSWKHIKMQNLQNQNSAFENNDGAIYVMVDIENSTKALLTYGVLAIAESHLKLIMYVIGKFESLGFRKEFRGDGVLFWKMGTVRNPEMHQKTLSTLNMLENAVETRTKLATDGMTIIEKVTDFNLSTFAKIKMGVDASERYFYINATEPPISQNKVIAELCEKHATKDNKIISGESFLSILYMNDIDYARVVSVINNYCLFAIDNDYLRKSDKIMSAHKKWVPKVYKKNILIQFHEYSSNGSKVKNFGKEARNANSVELRVGHVTENTGYNGLHFYITGTGDVLQVFVNDGKGGYVNYGL